MVGVLLALFSAEEDIITIGKAEGCSEGARRKVYNFPIGAGSFLNFASCEP